MIGAALLVALGASAPVDGWGDVEKAARLVANAPSSPVLDRVRAEQRGLEGLFDAEVSESIEAVRATSAALAHLDAAAVAPLCKVRRPVDDKARAAVLALAEHALASALLDAHLDARDGRASRAASGVGRAVSLAIIVERCASPALEGFALALDIQRRACFLTWHLAEQRLATAEDLVTIARQMELSGAPAGLERALEHERARLKRAFTLEEQARIEGIGRRLDDAARDVKALATTPLDAVERPKAFDPMAVKLECKSGATPGAPRVVSRAVVRALELRGPELLGADTQVTPTFDGRGVEITRTGPFAASCGFADGDLLADVNGVSTARGDAMIAAPAQVARDGHAVFRVLRAGRSLELRVVVDGRR